MKKKISLIVILFLLIPLILNAKSVKTKSLIHCPTASSLEKGNLAYDTRIFGNGGVLSSFRFAFNKNFQLGVCYGGTEILGRDEAEFNKNPGVSLKYVFFTEDYYYPQIALGFTNQGYGYWNDNDDRYQIKSKGFYLVFSKNYIIAGNLGTLGTHLGMNYTVTEDTDDSDDKMVDLFVGFDKSLGSMVNVVLEYDFAFNDDSEEENSPTLGRGFFNAGIKFSLTNNFILEFDYNDILRNTRESDQGSREVKISYRAQF